MHHCSGPADAYYAHVAYHRGEIMWNLLLCLTILGFKLVDIGDPPEHSIPRVPR